MDNLSGSEPFDKIEALDEILGLRKPEDISQLVENLRVLDLNNNLSSAYPDVEMKTLAEANKIREITTSINTDLSKHQSSGKKIGCLANGMQKAKSHGRKIHGKEQYKGIKAIAFTQGPKEDPLRNIHPNTYTIPGDRYMNDLICVEWDLDDSQINNQATWEPRQTIRWIFGKYEADAMIYNLAMEFQIRFDAWRNDEILSQESITKMMIKKLDAQELKCQKQGSPKILKSHMQGSFIQSQNVGDQMTRPATLLPNGFVPQSYLAGFGPPI
ncbi:hypothetical protein GQ44DRAFT_769465 [Phaeosphaeriaceae sp. PMI808]|nr:hypothetical protein GQ44DRAFT_769465 [Phaeosphaeriaceae sp. PMI808]